MTYTDIQNIETLQIIPIDSKKIPTVRGWQASIEKHDLSKCYGIGLVCGAISNNIEAIDIDCKYDLTGTLFERYKALINDIDKTILKKLVVQKTMSGGYHFIYRCSEIEGNKKLANRYTNDAEKQADPKEKIKVLIETRGTGGYIAIDPTPKYKLIYGSLDKIQEITPEQRETLINCAKTFNEVYTQQVVKKEQQKIINDNLSPFNDWNNRGDVLDILEQLGWKIVLERGSKKLLLRPGGKGKWSADWDTEKRLFYVWTSSTEFENDKAYNPTQVLCLLKFNSDYSECAKWLLKNGYGSFQKPEVKKPEIILMDHIITFDQDEANILSFRNGTFKKGLTTGFPILDNYFLFKNGDFVCVNGHANIGKTITIAFLMALSAFLHKWRWIVFSSENRTWSIRKKLMEFYMNTPLTKMSERQYEVSKEWVKNMFTFISIERLYSAKELIEIAEKIKDNGEYNGFLVDPYNSLRIDMAKSDKFSTHEYHYEVASLFRIFANSNGISTFLNCHAVTESLRRKDKEGFPTAPFAEDTEGGGKFVNRADDFITLHRIIQHPTLWNETEFHVRKIKDVETGGKPTPFASPIILKMLPGGCGFSDATGFNPFEKTEQKDIFDVPKEQIINPNTNFYGPENSEIPF